MLRSVRNLIITVVVFGFFLLMGWGAELGDNAKWIIVHFQGFGIFIPRFLEFATSTAITRVLFASLLIPSMVLLVIMTGLSVILIFSGPEMGLLLFIFMGPAIFGIVWFLSPVIGPVAIMIIVIMAATAEKLP